MSSIFNVPIGRSADEQGIAPGPDLIAGLLKPEAYPHPVGPIQVIETHISWVFLTGRYAYKIKKPVQLSFLDFRALEQRRFYCEEELRLNRCWAPELYDEVVPVGLKDGAPYIGGGGPAVEYAVRMHQFDQAQRLDHLLDADQLGVADMPELAQEIAARHLAAERAGPASRLLLTTKRLMWENFDELIGVVAHQRIAALHGWTKESLIRHEALLKERCTNGFYRECHGDLHLGNLVRLASGIRAFDCIEFGEELRQIDVVADYGFLVMDLVARGRTDLAYAFLNCYLEIAGDYNGMTLLPLYFVYRCLVRAKVAAIRRRERDPGESSDQDTATLEHYSLLARTWTKPPRPVLVIMNGMSGTGKTWLSTRLVAAMPALRIRSDLERRRLFGLAENADSNSGIASGIYGPESGQSVYERIFEGARAVLDAGFDVILDATFLSRGYRKRAKRLARACGADFVIIRATAPLAVLEERVGTRAAKRTDASEADAEVLRFQDGTNEPLSAREALAAITVNTESEVDIATLILAIRHCRSRR